MSEIVPRSWWTCLGMSKRYELRDASLKQTRLNTPEWAMMGLVSGQEADMVDSAMRVQHSVVQVAVMVEVGAVAMVEIIAAEIMETILVAAAVSGTRPLGRRSRNTMPEMMML